MSILRSKSKKIKITIIKATKLRQVNIQASPSVKNTVQLPLILEPAAHTPTKA